MRMRTLSLCAVVVSLLAARQAAAESWVAKMLTETEHDFGTVARGADTEFRFPVKNVYKQDIELSSIRSSCGCTTPSLENKIIKTGEIGYVVAKFNTRAFEGIHSATLTLSVQWDDNGIKRFGEAQLRVHGNIRSDVVFEPGAVRFDSVDKGNKTEQKVRVTYAGRSDWKITDVRGASEALEVELTETQRYSGRVAYDLLVRVKDSAPAGYFQEQLVLVTNDKSGPRIPLSVEGRVAPQISISPESLILGEVAQGQHVPKKLLVRGKQPFKITSMESDGGSFAFKTDDKSSDRHVVEIVFDAKKNPGKVKETIHIATDMGDNFVATLTAYATIVPADDAPAASADSSASSDSDPEQVARQ